MFEPYAAKAIITHQWAVGSLSVWLTFRFPMNQTVKPADTVWLVTVDGTVSAVSSSAWQDAFTLLLIVGSITAAPALVAVKFDGPDSALETTWHKNWQPWGYIPSTDITATYLPAGMIILWSGSIATIPTGWAICDGMAGTPDLRDKFVVGAGTTYAVGDNANVSTHNHTFQSTSHFHTLPAGTELAAGSDYAVKSDSKSIVAVIGSKSHIPPYYALAFIMKL